MGYLLGKNFRRRDRDHLVPPRRMDAAVCRVEVCYPFGRKHGRHRAVNRREFITLPPRADPGGADPLLGRWALQLIKDQFTMLPEFVETSFECLKR